MKTGEIAISLSPLFPFHDLAFIDVYERQINNKAVKQNRA